MPEIEKVTRRRQAGGQAGDERRRPAEQSRRDWRPPARHWRRFPSRRRSSPTRSGQGRRQGGRDERSGEEQGEVPAQGRGQGRARLAGELLGGGPLKRIFGGAATRPTASTTARRPRPGSAAGGGCRSSRPSTSRSGQGGLQPLDRVRGLARVHAPDRERRAGGRHHRFLPGEDLGDQQALRGRDRRAAPRRADRVERHRGLRPHRRGHLPSALGEPDADRPLDRRPARRT